MNSETIQNMLKGQKNIDRMSEEIEAITTTMLGFVGMLPLPQEANTVYEHAFEGASTVWEIERRKNKFNVACLRLYPTGNVEIYSTRTIPRVLLEDVEEVHDSLETFVEGILKTFPQLANHVKWQALQRAGRKVMAE